MIAADDEFTPYGLTEPLIAIGKAGTELFDRFFREVESKTLTRPSATLSQRERELLRADAIDASGFFVDAALVVAGVIDPLLVEVRDVDATVGAKLDIDWAEPGIGRLQGEADVLGLERGAVGQDVAHHDVATKRMNAEQPAVVLIGERAAVVDDEGVREPLRGGAGHGFEVAKGERIGEVAVLAEALLKVAALDVMKTAGVAAVVAAVDAALGVELQAERV